MCIYIATNFEKRSKSLKEITQEKHMTATTRSAILKYCFLQTQLKSQINFKLSHRFIFQKDPQSQSLRNKLSLLKFLNIISEKINLNGDFAFPLLQNDVGRHRGAPQQQVKSKFWTVPKEKINKSTTAFRTQNCQHHCPVLLVLEMNRLDRGMDRQQGLERWTERWREGWTYTGREKREGRKVGKFLRFQQLFWYQDPLDMMGKTHAFIVNTETLQI